jgi:uncharacterized protein (DUF1697 family)
LSLFRQAVFLTVISIRGPQVNTYIALFRGINVGGKNILPMKDLVGILEGIGCDNVVTYIQSGNVVFQSKKKQLKNLTREISSKVSESYEFQPKVLLLEISQLQDAIDYSPFKTKDGKALHFFFLDSHPEKPDLEKLKAVKSKSEKFELINNVFYLYAPDGIGKSKLAVKVEQCLGVPVTARNWNTVSKLVSMVGQ